MASPVHLHGPPCRGPVQRPLRAIGSPARATAPDARRAVAVDRRLRLALSKDPLTPSACVGNRLPAVIVREVRRACAGQTINPAGTERRPWLRYPGPRSREPTAATGTANKSEGNHWLS